MADRILVVGDLIDDVVVVPSGPIRRDTDTVSDIRSTPGGSAANTAAWLAHIGASVAFVGAVAEVDVARHALDLAAHGVDAQLQGSSLPTGAIVVIVEGEERTMLTSRGANTALDPSLIDVSGYRLLHLTGHSLFTGAVEPWLDLIARARAAGLEVCIDPGSAAYIADLGVDRCLEIMEGATIIVPNLEEGRALTGLSDPIEICAAIAESFGTVALTLDARGAVVAGGGAPIAVPAIPAAIVDPTGAGDSFTAGFLAALLDGDAVDVAAHAGAALAARAVSAIGARPLL